LLAEVAGKARPVDPLYTSVVTDLDIIDKVTLGNNDTSTFVATNKR
jgi:hypothetical protein